MTRDMILALLDANPTYRVVATVRSFRSEFDLDRAFFEETLRDEFVSTADFDVSIDHDEEKLRVR